MVISNKILQTTWFFRERESQERNKAAHNRAERTSFSSLPRQVCSSSSSSCRRRRFPTTDDEVPQQTNCPGAKEKQVFISCGFFFFRFWSRHFFIPPRHTDLIIIKHKIDMKVCHKWTSSKLRSDSVCAYILVETLAIMNGGSPRWIRGGSLKSHSLVSHVSHSFVVVGVYNSLQQETI